MQFSACRNFPDSKKVYNYASLVILRGEKINCAMGEINQAMLLRLFIEITEFLQKHVVIWLERNMHILLWHMYDISPHILWN